MRVLFVNQYYPPDASATAYLLGELAEDLARHHEVWVVAGRPSYNPESSTYVPVGVHLERTWSTSFRRVGLAGRFANYSTFALMALARSLSVPKPGVVVAMTDPPVIGLIGLLAARRFRRPFVYICEDIFPDVGVALKRLDNPLTVWVWRGLNRRLREAATRIVAIGRDMVDKLRDEGVPGNKIELIPNWANSIPDRVDVAAVRASMGWEGKHVVMHAGNLGLAQNLMVTIDAAERLRDDPKIQIVFVGGGALRDTLEREVAQRAIPNVRFLPYCPKDEVHDLISAADVHLVSLSPGLKGCVVPSKIYGILAAGRPFIAAVEAESEIDLLARDWTCGIRVDPGDEIGLSDALVATKDMPLDVMGARGRRAFEEHYERTKATDAYRRLLEMVAEDAR